MVSSDALPIFSGSLLQQGICIQQIQFIERLFGKPESYAKNVAEEIVRDMDFATNYPPGIKEEPVIANIVTFITELTDSLRRMK